MEGWGHVITVREVIRGGDSPVERERDGVLRVVGIGEKRKKQE